MQIAEPFLLGPDGARHGAIGSSELRPWVIEPWLAAPADIVVYEFGARLDSGSQVAADAQILHARGFRRARPLAGGLDAWIASGRIVEHATATVVLDRHKRAA